MTTSDLSAAHNQSIERLESRAAIADLVHRYALNIRSGNGADSGGLFTEDAVFEVRDGNPLDPAEFRTRARLSGRKAILDYIVQSTGSGIRMCPMIHNLLIELDGQTDGKKTAHSSCLMTARSWPAGHELIGEYRDSFRNESGWRFSSRLYTIYGSPPA